MNYLLPVGTSILSTSNAVSKIKNFDFASQKGAFKNERKRIVKAIHEPKKISEFMNEAGYKTSQSRLDSEITTVKTKSKRKSNTRVDAVKQSEKENIKSDNSNNHQNNVEENAKSNYDIIYQGEKKLKKEKKKVDRYVVDRANSVQESSAVTLMRKKEVLNRIQNKRSSMRNSGERYKEANDYQGYSDIRGEC